MTLNDPSNPVFALPPQSLRIDADAKVKVYGLALASGVDKRVLWMLNELGIPYEHVGFDLLKGENTKPEYTRIHPSGLVPAIQVGDFYMIESAAILMLLADRFPERRLAPPPDDIERPAYLQWMLYGAATLEPVARRVILAVPRGIAPNEAELKAQLEIFDRFVMTLEKVLEEREYLLQSGFSAADISVAWPLYLTNDVGLLEQYPTLKRYFDRLATRPGFQAAFRGEAYYELAERIQAARAAKRASGREGSPT